MKRIPHHWYLAACSPRPITGSAKQAAAMRVRYNRDNNHANKVEYLGLRRKEYLKRKLQWPCWALWCRYAASTYIVRRNTITIPKDSHVWQNLYVNLAREISLLGFQETTNWAKNKVVCILNNLDINQIASNRTVFRFRIIWRRLYSIGLRKWLVQ